MELYYNLSFFLPSPSPFQVHKSAVSNDTLFNTINYRL